MKIDITKALKISIGVCLSIVLASFLGVQNAVTAGIVTILSVQDTKKETFRLAGKRIFCFLIAIVIAFICFKIGGYTVLSFGVFVLLFIPFCQVVKMPESVSVCCVLVSHFLVKKTMNLSFIFEETLILLIGAGVGIVVNLFLRAKEKDMRTEQKQLDNAFREVLYSLAEVLYGEKTFESMTVFIENMSSELQKSRKKAFALIENSLLEDQSYYMSYFELRQGQFLIVEQIYNHTMLLKKPVPEAIELADFIKDFANNLHECNDGSLLLQKSIILKKEYEKSELPVTREEFESRAVLFSILDDIIHILLQKKFFVSNLTESQKDKFMNVCEI